MKQLSNTKATVRIRKAEDRKEWYLYIESYPVYVDGKPTRVRQYLNRSVTTIEWDKNEQQEQIRTAIKHISPSEMITA